MVRPNLKNLSFFPFTSQCLAEGIVSSHIQPWSICCKHQHKHGSWSWQPRARSSQDEISFEGFRLDHPGWSMAGHCLTSAPRLWLSHPCNDVQLGNPSHTNCSRHPNKLHLEKFHIGVDEHHKYRETNYLRKRFQVSLFITPEGSSSCVISWLSLKCALSKRILPPGEVSSIKPKSIWISLPKLQYHVNAYVRLACFARKSKIGSMGWKRPYLSKRRFPLCLSFGWSKRLATA